MNLPAADTADRPSHFRFGVFEFDVRALELRKGGRRVRVQQQPLQILAVLLARQGQVVTREELRTELWASDVHVDYDRSLNKALVKLREALDDSATAPRFIETLPRIGYRFIALEPLTREAPPVTTKKRRLPMLAAATAAAIILATSAFLLLTRPPAAPAMQSLAVLPLANLTGDEGQDYFADGMTDELITNLAQIRELRVISRTSTMRYRSTQKTVQQIADELKVDGIVEGSVSRSANRIRITAQFIDARSDKHLWARSYEGEARDVLTLQDNVARDIAAEIRVALSGDERARLNRRRKVNPEAHDAYLRGLYHWNRRDRASLEKALRHYARAVALDPNDPLPHTGIAQSLIAMTGFGVIRGTDAAPRVMASLTKALALDRDSAQGHTAMGAARFFYQYDWDAAEREFRRAIAVNPNYATAHMWYAQLLGSEGRTAEALGQHRMALASDPLSLPVNAGWGFRLYRARRYDEAAAFLTRVALDLDPHHVMAQWYLGCVLMAQKKYPAAIAELEQAEAAFSGNDLIAATLGNAYAASGDRARAHDVLERMTTASKTRYVDPYAFAIVHAGLGEKDQAFAWLAKAIEDRDGTITFINNEPMLDPLRSDARFTAMLRDMRIPLSSGR